MRSSAVVLAFALLGCGGGPSSPMYQDVGACVPPSGTTAVRTLAPPAAGLGSQCLKPGLGAAAQVLRSAAEYAAAMDLQRCGGVPAEQIDFTTTQVIVAYGYTGQANTLRHLTEDAGALYLSLYHAPAGAPPPDLILWTPRNDKQLRIGDCTAVCQRNCDQPVP